ncbi:MAG: N-succinylarginine dihydrolase [Betaproteobacteria bacterium]|nr:N-succinylarginine dihydrolase [Betaproteobacteria bacterium]
MAREYNFDGLVGPTHNYAGLSFGNVASTKNLHQASNPRAAALQGLAKAKALADRGFAQAILPPQARPRLDLLRSAGFTGSDAAVLAGAAREEPQLLAAAYSASPMWTANAATVSPSADCADGRLHLSAANLNNKLHRALEHPATSRVLRLIFADQTRFAVHEALPGTPALGDEGAANHTRLCAAHGAQGVEFFVFGRSEFDAGMPAPRRYPARQTLEASRAVARRHGLSPARTVFAQQNPEVIDQGVFHNDVIAVGSGELLFYHQDAFRDEARVLTELTEAAACCEARVRTLRVARGEVSVADAVASYLFNSQLLLREDGKALLVAPQECREHPRVARYLERLVAADGPIAEVISFDLRQSMNNGGGPACLRLRVVLNEQEELAMHQGVKLTDALYAELTAWVERHYRDRLETADFTDPGLMQEVREALAALEVILGLPGLYT